ncbi:DUF2974 domain-containing protein [Lactobacillus salivarius]|uniref:DUF2974 domain-containing protein n=1 Tax=Ligilactobacillus salivarius TaxID=1624 RepID=A0A7X2SRB1_9LACO|nr:DUF2974 domain-containing protein [Ligilactobacillus salivarius]
MERKYKYSIRKKAGLKAASYVVGVLLIGGGIVYSAPKVNADEVTPKTEIVSSDSSINKDKLQSNVTTPVTENKAEDQSNTTVTSNETSNTSNLNNTAANNQPVDRVTAYPTETTADNNSDYRINDSDGDGIINQYDKNPNKWDVSDRDLRFFTELSYRSQQELEGIFANNEEQVNKFDSEKTYNVADVREVISAWKFAKQINATDGFSASLFSTKDGQVVVAFRGTDDSKDADDDTDIFTGSQPGQIKNFSQVFADIQNYKEIYLTGHSLGGYLAEYFAATTLMNDDRFVRGAVFNAPGIKDSWSWISGNRVHKLAAENSKKLSNMIYINDADTRNPVTEHKMQAYSIHKDTVGSLYYYPNTKWAYAVNGNGTHSSNNFFGKKFSSEMRDWFTVGYRMDTPYVDLDADNDGFSNQVELAMGTNASDANSKPTLNSFYKVNSIGSISVPTFSGLSKELVKSKIATNFDNQYDYYKSHIPTVIPAELGYEYLNYPETLADNVEHYNVQVQVVFPDGSKSEVITVPVDFTQVKMLNQAKSGIKDKINQMTDLTNEQKADLVKKVDDADKVTDLTQIMKDVQASVQANIDTAKKELEKLVAEAPDVQDSIQYKNTDEDKKNNYDTGIGVAKATLADDKATLTEINKVIEQVNQAKSALDGKEVSVEEPNTPSEPETPGKETDTSSEPEEPGEEAKTPSEPETPGKEAETSGESETPGKETETSSEPEKPDKETETPSESETPSEPETPGKETETSSEPEEPGKEVETPSEPETPGKEVETPSEPETPGKEAETPSEPEAPGKETETSSEPEEPGKEVETSSEPETPGKEAETLSEPETPGKETETSSESEEPDKEAEIPSEPETPGEEVETPSETEEPGKEAETPSEPEKPDKETETPSESENPGKEAETSGEPETPGKEPETSSEPETPGKEAETLSEPETPDKETETSSELEEPGKEVETPSEPEKPDKETETPSELENLGEKTSMLSKIRTPDKTISIENKVDSRLKVRKVAVITPTKKSLEDKKDLTVLEKKLPQLNDSSNHVLIAWGSLIISILGASLVPLSRRKKIIINKLKLESK